MSGLSLKACLGPLAHIFCCAGSKVTLAMESVNLFSEQTGRGTGRCRSKHMRVAKDDKAVFGAGDGNVQHVMVYVVELASTNVILPIDAGEQH